MSTKQAPAVANVKGFCKHAVGYVLCTTFQNHRAEFVELLMMPRAEARDAGFRHVRSGKRDIAIKVAIDVPENLRIARTIAETERLLATNRIPASSQYQRPRIRFRLNCYNLTNAGSRFAKRLPHAVCNHRAFEETILICDAGITLVAPNQGHPIWARQ